MQYSISGEIAQSARLAFAPGEHAWVSKGVLMAYSPRCSGACACRAAQEAL